MAGAAGELGDAGAGAGSAGAGSAGAGSAGAGSAGAGSAGSGFAGSAAGPADRQAAGLSWSWELDLAALIDAVSGPAPWLREAVGSPPGEGPTGSGLVGPAVVGADPGADPGADAEGDPEADPEADEEAYREAVAAGRVRDVPLEVAAGRVAESLPTGPGLAGWLAQSRAADLEDGALAGVAASFRRLASWAAAGELAAVAQIASRSARADRRAGVDTLGRPDRITSDAAGQVALALAMSHDGASSWIDLGIVLTWRLPATGAALAAGRIDLARARMIVRMTTPLSDAAARQVEAAVLGRAGWLTLGQLHAALRRAVIKADPEGAERRREHAERNAKVVLYPEDEGTATLAGYSLPGVQAAAAMARVTAMAKALKAAGTAGGIDLVRAQVFIGLLLGTLPYFPPADGAPPDVPPPDFPPADVPPPDVPPADVPQVVSLPDPGTEGGGQWPGVLPFLPKGPAGLGRVQPAGGRGLLNLIVPFATLAGTGVGPGQLSRLGVITPAQARQLAELAAQHPGTRWRVVVATSAGEAIAVMHVPRPRGPTVQDPDDSVGLVRRVTVIVPVDAVDQSAAARDAPAAPTAESPLSIVLAGALRAARRAAEHADARRRADDRSGGCAHTQASAAYRPPRRLVELVTARDGSCRFGPCRRPAEQCDLDHVTPFWRGGLTCSCNLGSQCRTHHQLKQHPGWTLAEPTPGVFRWTTPAGRCYIVRPDPHVV